MSIKPSYRASKKNINISTQKLWSNIAPKFSSILSGQKLTRVDLIFILFLFTLSHLCFYLLKSIFNPKEPRSIWSLFWQWIYEEHERDGKMSLSWGDELQKFVGKEKRDKKKEKRREERVKDK